MHGVTEQAIELVARGGAHLLSAARASDDDLLVALLVTCTVSFTRAPSFKPSNSSMVTAMPWGPPAASGAGSARARSRRRGTSSGLSVRVSLSNWASPMEARVDLGEKARDAAARPRADGDDGPGSRAPRSTPRGSAGGGSSSDEVDLVQGAEAPFSKGRSPRRRLAAGVLRCRGRGSLRGCLERLVLHADAELVPRLVEAGVSTTEFSLSQVHVAMPSNLCRVVCG